MPALLWIVVFLAVFAAGLAMQDGPGGPAMILTLAGLGLAASLLGLVFAGQRDLLRMLGRGGLILLPIVLLAAIPIVLVIAAPLDARLQQAFIAGLVLMTGWVATFVFQEDRRARERRETEFDTLLALRAEMLNFVWKYGGEDIGAQVTRLRDAPEAPPPGGRISDPFLYGQADPIVFRAVAETLPSISDADALKRIVQFYAQLEDVARVADDLKTDRFRALPWSRRRPILIRFFGMQQVALDLAELAIVRVQEVVPSDRWAADTDRPSPDTASPVQP